MTSTSCARRTPFVIGLISLACLSGAGVALCAQTPDHPAVEGVKNFTRIDDQFATGGATSPSAMPTLASLGYKTVINLRRSSEQGADVDAERASAEANGLRYVSLPFDGKHPDGATVEAFLRLIDDSAGQRVFVHCSSGNRTGALWLVKRVVVDGWAIESAAAEARAAGLSDEVLEAWVAGYSQGRLR